MIIHIDYNIKIIVNKTYLKNIFMQKDPDMLSPIIYRSFNMAC